MSWESYRCRSRVFDSRVTSVVVCDVAGNSSLEREKESAQKIVVERVMECQLFPKVKVKRREYAELAVRT